MLLNWVKKGNVQKWSDRSKLWNRYREPIGKYPKIDYSFLKDQSAKIKAKKLEEDLQKEIGFSIVLEDEIDIRKFIEHLEYWYQISFRKKIYTRYLGLFYFVCPHNSEYQDCEFHLKFTKYGDGNFPVLVSYNFLHSHDPWIEVNKSYNQVSEFYGPGLDNVNTENENYKVKGVCKKNELSQINRKSKQNLKFNEKSKQLNQKENNAQYHTKKLEKQSAKSKKKIKQKQKIVIEIDDSDDSNYASSDLEEGNDQLDLVISNSVSEKCDSIQDRLIMPDFNLYNQSSEMSESIELKKK